MVELAEAVQQPLNHPEVKIPLYIIQGFATFVGLIVAPAVYLLRAQRSLGELLSVRGIEWTEDLPYWYVPAEERLPRDRTR